MWTSSERRPPVTSNRGGPHWRGAHWALEATGGAPKCAPCTCASRGCQGKAGGRRSQVAVAEKNDVDVAHRAPLLKLTMQGDEGLHSGHLGHTGVEEGGQWTRGRDIGELAEPRVSREDVGDE